MPMYSSALVRDAVAIPSPMCMSAAIGPGCTVVHRLQSHGLAVIATIPAPWSSNCATRAPSRRLIGMSSSPAAARCVASTMDIDAPGSGGGEGRRW